MHINTNTGFLFSGCLNITHKGSLKTLQNLFSDCLIVLHNQGSLKNSTPSSPIFRLPPFTQSTLIQTNVSKSSQNA